MKYDDFHLVCEFKTGNEKTFRCTDIGQRVIVAVLLIFYFLYVHYQQCR